MEKNPLPTKEGKTNMKALVPHYIWGLRVMGKIFIKQKQRNYQQDLLQIIARWQQTQTCQFLSLPFNE